MRRALSLIALLWFYAPAHADDALSPEQVIARIKVHGPGAVALEIWSSDSQTKALLAGVSAGNSAWLQAAKAIQPVTDGGAAEDLADALSEALINKPYTALPLLRQLWWKSDQEVCVFAYDSELPGGVPAYIARLERALSRTPPSQLRSLRKLCLQGISRTKQALSATPQ